MGLREDVAEFHRAFGVPVHETPRVPDANRVDLRLRLVAEEFCEFLDALGCTPDHVERVKDAVGSALLLREIDEVDIVGVADALGDLDYVAEGTRLEFGINGGPIADEIQRSNMSKVGSALRGDGKITKGPNYSPPDVERVLREQGWTGPEGTKAK